MLPLQIAYGVCTAIFLAASSMHCVAAGVDQVNLSNAHQTAGRNEKDVLCGVGKKAFDMVLSDIVARKLPCTNLQLSFLYSMQAVSNMLPKTSIYLDTNDCMSGCVVITLPCAFEAHGYILSATNGIRVYDLTDSRPGRYAAESNAAIALRRILNSLASNNYCVQYDFNYFAKDCPTRIFAFFSWPSQTEIKQIYVIDNFDTIVDHVKSKKYPYRGIYKDRRNYEDFKKSGFAYSDLIDHYPDIIETLDHVRQQR